MIHKLLDQFKELKLEFARTPRLDLEAGILNCDCAGFITLLLKNQTRMPKELGPNPKAFQYFDYIKGKGGKNNIKDLKRYDVLVWRKKEIPKSGDTGHLLLLTSPPKKVEENKYSLSLMEVTKGQSYILERTILLETKKDGTLFRIHWDPESKKVKETEILGFSFFDSKDCPKCLYPLQRCLCEDLPGELWEAPEIFILKHPSENDQAFASVPLLEKSFKNLNVIEGEIFPKMEGTLIYPLEESVGETLTESGVFPPVKLPLILVDATWRKSKKILLSNPWLLELPRLEIQMKEVSQFKIRKQIDEYSYSTLETFAFLWRKMDPPKKANADQLLRIFKTFNEKQELFFR